MCKKMSFLALKNVRFGSELSLLKQLRHKKKGFQIFFVQFVKKEYIGKVNNTTSAIYFSSKLPPP